MKRKDTLRDLLTLVEDEYESGCRMISRLLLPLALGLILTAGLPTAVTAQTGADGGLQPGDVVTVTVWQREELSGEFTVAPDGSLNHPLYRQVRVTGIPVDQVEERMRSFLSAYESNPQLVVQPQYRVAVSGQVMQPNIYNLPPGTTVGQAVAGAGGVSEAGQRDDVRLIRSGRETRLNLSEAAAMQMPVQSGDQILVTTERTGGGFRSAILPILQVVGITANIINITTR
jgi:protein involved in polysaccharide export with SLBB domain